MIELVLRSEARYFELAQLEAAIDRKLDVLHFKGRVNTNSSLINYSANVTFMGTS